MIGTGQSQTDRERLEAQRDQMAAKLEEVRGLLTKADARLREDPDNRKRWFSVVENLEASLTEVKSRLEAIQTELNLLAQRGSDAATAPVVPGSTAESAADRMLEMPLSELPQMSLEDIAQVEGQLKAEPQDDERRSHLQARIELANQLREDPATEDSEDMPARRSQVILRSALNKIQTGRIETMNASELHVTISCYELMVRRVNPTPSDLRLKRILSGAINILQRKRID